MVTPELLDYIKKELAKVEPEDTIRHALLAKDWDEASIDEAFTSIKKDEAKKQFFSLHVRRPTKKQFIWSLATLLFLALVGAGTYFAYATYFLNPNRILGQAIGNIYSAKSFSYSGNIVVEYNQSQRKPVAVAAPLTFSFAMIGKFTRDHANSPRLYASTTANAGAITVAEFDIKRIAPYLYLQVRKLSELGFVDNAKVLDKWIQIDATAFPVADPVLGHLLQTIETPNKEQIAHLLAQSFPFEITQEFPIEKVDGADTYHYEYRIDRKKLQTVINELVSDPTLTPLLTTRLAEFDIKQGDVWITKENRTLKRLTFTIARTGSEADAPTLQFKGDMRFQNFNQTEEIVAPASYFPMQEVIQDISTSLKKL